MRASGIAVLFSNMFFKKKESKVQAPEEVLAMLGSLQNKINELEGKISLLEEENKKMIQKVGMIRFNPFSGTGGDQSFSLALLNKENDGLTITSYYSNGGSSVYGKPIKKGKSRYPLSNEEEKAIKDAIVR